MTRAEYEAQKQSLLAEIERTFGGITREDGVPFSFDDLARNLTPEAQEELLSLGADIEARWQDIPDQLIGEYGHFILSFADAQSFRYYLPAFLTWYLRFVDCKDESPYSVSFLLNLSELIVDLRPGPQMADYQRAKFAFITPDQAKVIARFLIFQIERLILLDEEGELSDASADYDFLDYEGEYKSCKRALDNYWGQFWAGEIPALSERQLTLRIPKKIPNPQKLAAYEANKQALIAEIERVFDGVERGDGVTLHEADVIDNYGGLEARASARQLDTETRWQDVPDEDIRWGSSNLSFMDEKGFHYYFPAYLVWYLRFIDCEEEGFGSNTFESVDYRLYRHDRTDIPDSIKDYFNVFTNEEKGTIAHFLQFQLEPSDFTTEAEELDEVFEKLVRQHNEDIQWALDNYWGQFL